MGTGTKDPGSLKKGILQCSCPSDFTISGKWDTMQKRDSWPWFMRHNTGTEGDGITPVSTHIRISWSFVRPWLVGETSRGHMGNTLHIMGHTWDIETERMGHKLGVTGHEIW